MDALLVATTNLGKIREIRLALRELPLTLLTLADVPHVPEPEETGRTFADNARLKASYYAAVSGHVTVGEDSGLVIDPIGGRPGVESARYPGKTYAEKFAGLYRELAPHPRPWTARFVCSLAVASGREPDRVIFTAEATVEGEIAESPRGTNGFGYDPIFYFPPYRTTLADVDDARKLTASHRGKAFTELKGWLELRDVKRP